MLVEDLVQKNQRLDNRELNELRDIHVERYDNMLILRSGLKPKDSCVIFYYSKQIAKPYNDRPAEGAVIINLEKGKKDDILLNFLNNTFRNSKCISTTDLSIKFNQEAFFIYIEVCPIQVDGDLFRLCVEGINEIIHLLEVKTYFTPKAFQFSGLLGKVISDPTDYEITNCKWQMNVVMKSSREMLTIEKTGEGIRQEVFTMVIDEVMQKIKNG